MDVLLQSTDILSEHVHLCDLDILLHTELLSDLIYWLIVFTLVEVGNITTVEDVVDILKLLLFDDLCIDEEERSRFVVHTSLHKHLFDILSPVGHSVSLDDLNLEQFVGGNESCQSGKGLST